MRFHVGEDIRTLREQFESHGQGHVFRFWDRLDEPEREALAAQAAALDLPGLLAELARVRGSAPGPPGRIEPIPVERLPGRGGDAARHEAAAQRGEALLREGRVACLVVAGGQASRLGFPGPKGCFPIGPVSDRSLFAVQAQKLRRLAARVGRTPPWYVMTSPATDADTRDFFAKHQHFGLDPADVGFFRQGMVPSFDFRDRLLLAEPGRLAENPDGHGGCLTALLASGTLDDMERRGVDTLFYYQVDNPLVRMGDPAFLGFHAEAGAEVSCKVVRKQDPAEKVGIVARVDGAAGVVEYTELPGELAAARAEDGGLLHWAGSIAIHVFDLAFVRRIAAEADRWLPFHASQKKIPHVDEDGRPVRPDAPNGRKLERFVFDALPAAERVCVVETDRAEEFSPVKNASGVDSPETSRRDLSAQVARWLRAAGLDPPADAVLELDRSQVDSVEDLKRLGPRDLDEAASILRIQTGAHA